MSDAFICFLPNKKSFFLKIFDDKKFVYFLNAASNDRFCNYVIYELLKMMFVIDNKIIKISFLSIIAEFGLLIRERILGSTYV